MIILGIDPGIATLGYGVIEKDERGNCRAIDCGVVVTPKEEGLPVRLAMLEEGVSKILEKYHPDEVAMEELFFSKNITTGIAVAHARGVALLTLPSPRLPSATSLRRHARRFTTISVTRCHSMQFGWISIAIPNLTAHRVSGIATGWMQMARWM